MQREDLRQTVRPNVGINLCELGRSLGTEPLPGMCEACIPVPESEINRNLFIDFFQLE